MLCIIHTFLLIKHLINVKAEHVSISVSLKIIGRVSADPDYLPRTNDFGLNVAGFLQQYHPPQCPSAFLPLAVLCCDMDADKRYERSNTTQLQT